MGVALRQDVIDPADILALESEVIALDLSRELEAEIAAAIAEFGGVELQSLGFGVAFNVIDARVIGYLTDFSSFKIVGINRTTRDAIALALAEGVAQGEGMDALGRRIRTVFRDASVRRSVVIARTEANRAGNFARALAHRQSGIVDKRKWLATRDRRTRDTHRSLNGQIRDINEPFQIPGTQKRAMFPGDFNLPEEDINCRCTTVAVIEPVKDQAGDTPRRPKRPRPSDRETQDLFDARVISWERRLERAFQRAFRRQQTRVLDRLVQLDRQVGRR